MKLFEILTKPEIETLLEKTEVRNVELFDLTVEEVTTMAVNGVIPGWSPDQEHHGSPIAQFLDTLFQREKKYLVNDIANRHSIFFEEKTEGLPEHKESADVVSIHDVQNGTL